MVNVVEGKHDRLPTSGISQNQWLLPASSTHLRVSRFRSFTASERAVRLVLVILPNGTHSLIPAAWTNWNREPASTPTSRISHGLGRLDDLLQLRRIISTMIEVDRFMRLVHLPLGNTERLVRRAHRRHPVASCFDHTTTSPRSLCSNPITGLHRSYGSVRPSVLHRYSRLAVFAACASRLPSEPGFLLLHAKTCIRFTLRHRDCAPRCRGTRSWPSRPATLQVRR